MKKTILCLHLMLLSLSGARAEQSAVLINESEIKQIEQQVIKVLAEKNAPPDRYYLAYLLGARALKGVSMMDKAEEYFIKARDLDLLDLKIDKTEIYLELCSIASIKKKKDRVKQRVQEARNYFAKNEAYKKDLTLDVLDYYEGKKIKNKDSPFAIWAGQMISEKELQQKIEDKKYAEALAMLNAASLKKSADLGLQATYDLLVTLNQIPIDEKDYLCKKTLDKYPNSYTYSMLVCAAVIEYQKTKKLAPKTIAELEKYFKNFFQHKSHLLSAVKDLAAMKTTSTNGGKK